MTARGHEASGCREHHSRSRGPVGQFHPDEAEHDRESQRQVHQLVESRPGAGSSARRPSRAKALAAGTMPGVARDAVDRWDGVSGSGSVGAMAIITSSIGVNSRRPFSFTQVFPSLPAVGHREAPLGEATTFESLDVRVLVLCGERAESPSRSMARRTVRR